jgi:hypothetical protein
MGYATVTRVFSIFRSWNSHSRTSVGACVRVRMCVSHCLCQCVCVRESVWCVMSLSLCTGVHSHKCKSAVSHIKACAANSIHKRGGTILGSSRGNNPHNHMDAIMDRLTKEGINQVQHPHTHTPHTPHLQTPQTLNPKPCRCMWSEGTARTKERMPSAERRRGGSIP